MAKVVPAIGAPAAPLETWAPLIYSTQLPLASLVPVTRYQVLSISDADGEVHLFVPPLSLKRTEPVVVGYDVWTKNSKAPC